MKIIIIIVICLSLLPSLSIAETLEEERRVEEEKREKLRPSEVQIAEEEVQPPPISPEDFIYFIELMQKRITFRYDACKAMVILMGVEDEYIDLDSQIAFLRENHFLPKKIESDFDPILPLRKGLAAYMFCKTLDIKGGLCLWFLGINERYALQELAYEGIMASGNVNDIVSGEELISALTQASDYLAKKQQAKTSKSED